MRNRFIFSVFYGQTFPGSDSINSEQRYELSGPHLIRNVADLEAEAPLKATREAAIEGFSERRNYLGAGDSGTTVEDVINLIFIFRKLIRSHKAHKIQLELRRPGESMADRLVKRSRRREAERRERRQREDAGPGDGRPRRGGGRTAPAKKGKG